MGMKAIATLAMRCSFERSKMVFNLRERLSRIIGLGAAVTSVCWSFPATAEGPVIVPAHQLIDGLLRVMKAGGPTSFSDRFNMLAPVIDQTFDLTAILRSSVGPAAWQSLPPDQQELLLKPFRQYTIASYVSSSFDGFNGQRFTVNPETRSVGIEQVVQTKIIPVTGDGHDLDYVMRQGPAGWRIVDVLADGTVSRVAVQWSDFRQLIRQGGEPTLSQSLNAKFANLSN
jgi:phospholipid transport system substrate-binding protein